MRIYLKLSPNKKLVPYTYQENLVGTFHKWIGQNEIHDDLSLYSLSWLSGGKGCKKGLEFKSGACWFIGSPNVDIIKKLIAGIQNDPTVAFGMTVTEITINDTPDFSNNHRFYLETPVFVKRRIGDKDIHYTFQDNEVNNLMTETLKSKLREAGKNIDNISVKFDKTYHHPKTKLIQFKGIKNKANFCPVILEGDPAAIRFAWDVGIGNCTGIGFGALQ